MYVYYKTKTNNYYHPINISENFLLKLLELQPLDISKLAFKA